MFLVQIKAAIVSLKGGKGNLMGRKEKQTKGVGRESNGPKSPGNRLQKASTA